MSDFGFVYILCSKKRTALYTGVTNSLKRRLDEYINSPQGHVAKYNINNLVYYERIAGLKNAIAREKQIKGMSREKKNALIKEFNPDWSFLNEEFI